MNNEDEEFNRIERESKQRMEAVHQEVQKRNKAMDREYVRPWVGLTDAEMKQTCYEVCSYDPYTIARAIEAKLKERNT
jgi:hypothetical protein